MAKDRGGLSPKQKRNIAAAFRKNRTRIDAHLAEARRKIMKSHAKLESWLLSNDGEDPKGSNDGRP